MFFSLLCRVFGATIALLLFLSPVGFAQTPTPPPTVSKAEVDRWMTELSNWGRWGKEDQIGAINLITPAKRKQAVALVRDGVSVSLSRDIVRDAQTSSAGRGTGSFQHIATQPPLDRPNGFNFDVYTMSYHGYVYTHLDALSHMFYQGRMYNGFARDEVTAAGAAKLDIQQLRDGIVTRGVLVDLPWLKGVPYLDTQVTIYPADLDAWEKKSGVKISSGDAVFVRTGRWARQSALGPWNLGSGSAGLDPSTARWFKQRDIALLGSDVVSDHLPSGVEETANPIHQLMIVAMGVHLFDNCDLEAVAEAAQRRKRWAFLLTVAPLRVVGGTGSPTNPIATF